MIACLQGGMGNQMFQYAMAKSAARRLGATLWLNTKRFRKDDPTGRIYSLSLWKGITASIRSDEYSPIHELGMPYNQEIVDLIKPESSLIGYWQTEKYFSDIADILREEFVPKQERTHYSLKIEELIKAAGDRSVFLTVRRTDYLTSDYHGVLSMDYYMRALNTIAEKVDPVVFVFSDEPEWCKINFKIPYPMIVAGNYKQTDKFHLGREDEELTLMKHCKHAVLANSSYSWWGAWLNPNSGIVIAPKQWFLSSNEDPKDIIPDRWLKI